MTKGISLYPGMGYSPEQSFAYLALAKKNGFSTLFTSLHIPEADAANILSEFQELAREAARLGFKITADISPAGLKWLGAALHNLTPLKKLGLSALRLDFGFSAAEIARLSQKGEFNLELNASVMPENVFRQIVAAGADLQKITVCHNYYPRPETGLSFALLQKRSEFFRAMGVKVAAFIPSLENRRGPIYAGLPTLEEHRCLTPLLAAKHLFYSGCADEVRFGDPLAKAEEIIAVGALSEDCAELNIDLFGNLSAPEAEILFFTHTNRYDPGEWTIRSAEARGLATTTIASQPPSERKRGSVTIDNQKYLRYMGELQILKKDFPPDARVNVVGKVKEEEIFLLNFIKPGERFRLLGDRSNN